ncbi:MAG TPA: SHOCT domain-containing protein [Gaiellales bacterium]|jgi:putative membrane protein
MTLLSTWHHHGWFLLWPLVPLFWITTVFLLVRFVFWRRGPWAGGRGPDPRAILAERYARGEITHDEYRERLGHLERP